VIPPPLLRLAGVTTSPRFAPELQVTRIDVRIADLPVQLDGLRITHLSDLHVGPPGWNALRLAEAADAVRQFDPDIVVNTGDFIQGEPPIDRVIAAVEPFLIAPHDGVDGPVNLAILGNHDYYAGEETRCALERALSDLDMRVLINDLACVRHDGAGLSIAGLSDREDRLDAMVEQLAGTERPRLVLLHEPDMAQRLPPGSADLVLAGHTHGGQITLPLLTGAIVRRFCGSRYIESFYRINDNPVYINRGLGCTGLPFRFRAAPEVTLLRLTR
jgi:predicted MPP superfamily phosphohydrolase